MLTSERGKLSVMTDAMQQSVVKDSLAGRSPLACGECGELDLAVPIEFGILEEIFQNFEGAAMCCEDFVGGGGGNAGAVGGWSVGETLSIA